MSKTRGRPTAIDKRIKEIAVRLAKEGKPMNEIARLLGVAPSTLFLYLQKDKDFSEHLKEAVNMADELVEIAMFQRAVGYRHPDEKIFCTPDGAIRRAKTMKYYPPSESAGAFWLSRRQPEKYGDKKESDIDEKPILLDYADKDL